MARTTANTVARRAARLLALAILGALSAVALVAPPATASTPATQRWSVHYHDSSGSLVRTWHGSQVEAERLIAAAQPAPSSAPVGRIAAIQRVSCHLPTTYWVFRSSGSRLTCFRYSGAVHVTIGSVYEVDSGNNSGRYIEGGRSHWLDPYTTDLWSSRITVTYIGLA